MGVGHKGPATYNTTRGAGSTLRPEGWSYPGEAGEPKLPLQTVLYRIEERPPEPRSLGLGL